ncbi:MAG TPA: TetR/AcrR family transcriptional regulator [Solirubrobacterales bacterium]
MTGSGQLPRGRHGIPREMVVRSQRERLLAAMIEMTAARGYDAISVADVLEASGVGRETFYELFEDKQDCFLAAHRILFDDFFNRVSTVYERPGPWPERVGNALTELLERLAADPDATKVLLIEIAKVGPASRELFTATFTRVTALLTDGSADSAAAAALPNVATIAGAAVFARIHEEVVLGRAAELPRLRPRLTYELLLPFVGEEEARKEERRLSAA